MSLGGKGSAQEPLVSNSQELFLAKRLTADSTRTHVRKLVWGILAAPILLQCSVFIGTQDFGRWPVPLGFCCIKREELISRIQGSKRIKTNKKVENNNKNRISKNGLVKTKQCHGSRTSTKSRQNNHYKINVLLPQVPQP